MSIRQKTLVCFLALILVTGMAVLSPVFAGTVSVDATEDGYFYRGAGIWYMTAAYAKAYENDPGGYGCRP